jgi:CHASE1-domain containing sensor protein
VDSIEQTTVAPLSRHATTGLRFRESLRSRQVLACFLLGVIATIVWSFFAAQRAREAARVEFEQHSLALATHVEQSFRAPLEALYAIHALGAALPDVSQRRFELFAGALRERYPSLAALELFDVVPRAERADFERRVSAQLGRPFTIQEPSQTQPGSMTLAGDRDRHVVLTRLLPYSADLHGLDIMFEATRREQVAAATLAGAPLATGKFRLVEDAEGVYSVAVYDALYADVDVPADRNERVRQLRGFAIALYRLEPLMAAALVGTSLERSAVALLDDAPNLDARQRWLFGSAKELGQDFRFRHNIHFAGRAWAVLTSRSAPSFVAAATPSLLNGAIGSVLLTLLVALWIALNRSRARFQALEALGPYTLLREIGSGGMGRVFEARHKLLRRRAAIKVIAHDSANEEQLRRFALEAKTTSELCHPNTVVVFDYGRTRRGDFYYAMEYVKGVDLERLVHRYGAQPAARVRSILVQACGALAEAHGLGLVHRDVKPGNLMIGVNGGIFDHVKVLDFGLVRVTRGVDAGKSGGNLLGTPRFMAPEAFASSQSGPRADLYALGCVAYYLLACHEPFVAKTDAGIATLHLTQKPASLMGRGKGDVTVAFEKVILRCLAKAPDERYASAQQLLRALSELELPAWTQADAAAFWAEYGAEQDKAESQGI